MGDALGGEGLGGTHSLRRQKELFSRGSILPKWAPQVPLFNVCS